MSLWGQGIWGSTVREKVISPLPHTHYGVRNRSHRLGGPEAWLRGLFPSSCAPTLDPLSAPFIQNDRNYKTRGQLSLKADKLCIRHAWIWWCGGRRVCFRARKTTHGQVNRYIKVGWNLRIGEGDAASGGIRGDWDLKNMSLWEKSWTLHFFKYHTFYIYRCVCSETDLVWSEMTAACLFPICTSESFCKSSGTLPLEFQRFGKAVFKL